MCGKNIQKLTKTQGMWGSPPRVREKHPQSNAISTVIRITPACAGKTCLGQLLHLVCRDHPRVCGKNNNFNAKDNGHPGSPPRVREKPRWVTNRPSVSGITPACAGKTFSGVGSSGMCKDHPRVCGKNFVLSSCYEAE